MADKLLQPDEIKDEMLPEPGFYYDSKDATTDSCTDSLLVDIPVKDRSLFADMVNRMG